MTENSASLRNYTYDSGGNILTDTRPGEVFGFAYNARNRPASVTRNSVPYASYSYNAFEQLVARSTAAPGGPLGTVHYIHDRDGHVIAEADASTGAITRDYIWMAANDNAPTDLPLAVAEGASLYMVHTDHLGRPTAMTDATKSTVWQAAYNPHGEATSLSGSVALNLRFPGQVFQIETGLAYNWHRHYDIVTGRYTQPDPLRFVDGPSIYAYAGNSPFMYVDRDGLQFAPAPPMPLPWWNAFPRPMPRPMYPPLPFSLPNSSDLPRTSDCKASERTYCEGRCGSRGVQGCYVSVGWQIKGVRGRGPIRVEKRTVNCNCGGDDGYDLLASLLNKKELPACR